MKSLAFLPLGALVLAGCGSVRYPTTYILNLPPPPAQTALSDRPLASVEVREFGCPDYLCEGRIVYRPSAEEVGFYEHHRWASNPRQAITQYLEDGLRVQSPFKSVASHERGSEAGYVLSGNIQRLEEVDQGRDVSAVCTLSAQVLDMRTRSVVWSHTASETIQVEKRDVPGVVSSLSAAAQAAANRLLTSMRQDLQAAVARDVTPGTLPLHLPSVSAEGRGKSPPQ